MTPRFQSSIASTTLFLLLAACGARSSMFYEDGEGTGGSGQGGAGQGGLASTNVSTSTASVSAVTTTVVVSSSGPVTSSITSTGASMTTVSSSVASTVTSSVASTVTSSVANTVVSTGTGMGGMVNCGTATCTSSEVCCFDDNNMNNNFCSQPGGCIQDTIEIECMGASDCGQGEVCCATFQWFGPGQEGYKGVKCVASCDDPPSNGQTAFLLCSDDPNVCTGNDTCQSSMVLPQGFKYCGN